MPWNVDVRVPVRFGTLADSEADDAVLIEGEAAAPPGLAAARFRIGIPEHPAGCACCLPRNPAASALAGLFQARAKGEVPFFRKVLIVTGTPASAAAVNHAIATDPLTAGRFRLS